MLFEQVFDLSATGVRGCANGPSGLPAPARRIARLWLGLLGRYAKT
jgi:hypothetical protein